MLKLPFRKALNTLYQLNKGKQNRIHLPFAKHPFYLRPNSSDLQLFYSIFLIGEYDLSLIHDPETIIDIGTNVGLFAIRMKSKYPNAKIICIEPDSENFALLQKNVAPYRDIVCENKGVWSRDTRLKISDKYGLGKWGMCVEEDEAGSVEAITINSILQKYNWSEVDLLKIDIEGSEKQLFSKAEPEWLLKVKTIVIELHDRYEPGCAQPFFEAINTYFKPYQYEVRAENTIITKTSLV